jgi:hypothetical protein
VRSIFDVLEERGNQDTDVTTASADEAELSNKSLDAHLSLSRAEAVESKLQRDTVSVRSTATTMEQIDDTNTLVSLKTSGPGSANPSTPLFIFKTLYTPKRYHHITLHGSPKTSWSTVDAWVRLEAECLFQATVKHNAPLHAKDESRTASQDLALVPYHDDEPSGAEQELASPLRSMRAETCVPTWHSKRIFFADVCGYTRLVDCSQTLYDVDVMMDDGASDFDSIASPMKLDPRVLSVPPLSTATSSE